MQNGVVEFRLETKFHLFILLQKVTSYTKPPQSNTRARIVVMTTQTASIARRSKVSKCPKSGTNLENEDRVFYLFLFIDTTDLIKVVVEVVLQWNSDKYIIESNNV